MYKFYFISNLVVSLNLWLCNSKLGENRNCYFTPSPPFRPVLMYVSVGLCTCCLSFFSSFSFCFSHVSVGLCTFWLSFFSSLFFLRFAFLVCVWYSDSKKPTFFLIWFNNIKHKKETMLIEKKPCPRLTMFSISSGQFTAEWRKQSFRSCQQIYFCQQFTCFQESLRFPIVLC